MLRASLGAAAAAAFTWLIAKEIDRRYKLLKKITEESQVQVAKLLSEVQGITAELASMQLSPSGLPARLPRLNGATDLAVDVPDEANVAQPMCGKKFGSTSNASLPNTLVKDDLFDDHLLRRSPGRLREAAPIPRGQAPSSPTQMVLISDAGQDLDDEMAFIMLRFLVEKRLVTLRGVIATLTPAFQRARLCRGTLDVLGLFNVRVGVGSDGGDTEGIHKVLALKRTLQGCNVALRAPD